MQLLSHIRRLHEDQSELTAGSNAQKKYIARLANDYHKYIFKCKDCSRGFKRRGMLVNHLAKAHPSISPSSIPELNIPLLRTQRDFYCTVCEWVQFLGGIFGQALFQIIVLRKSDNQSKNQQPFIMIKCLKIQWNFRTWSSLNSNNMELNW